MVKPTLIAIISCATGVVAGLALHAWFFDTRLQIRCALRQEVAWSRGAAMMSVPSLLALERGDTAAAQQQLVRNIATYQRTFGQMNVDLPGLPEGTPIIQSAIERSSILREELKKTGE